MSLNWEWERERERERESIHWTAVFLSDQHLLVSAKMFGETPRYLLATSNSLTMPCVVADNNFFFTEVEKKFISASN